MSLSDRLRRLELVRGARCPACGLGSSATGERAGYSVEWDYENSEPAEPEWCGECGQQTLFVVTWDDIEQAEVP